MSKAVIFLLKHKKRQEVQQLRYGITHFNLSLPTWIMLRTDLITKLDQRQLPGDATSWPEHVVPSAGTVSKNWATFVSIAPHHPYPS